MTIDVSVRRGFHDARCISVWLASCLALGFAMLLGTSSASAQLTPWTSGLTATSLPAGRDSNGEQLLVCRATDSRFPGRHPGKTARGWGFCAFGYGGVEQYATSYETLQMQWRTGSSTQAGTPFGNEGSTQLSVCLPLATQVWGGKRIAGVDSCAHASGNLAQELWTSSYLVLVEEHYGLEKVPNTTNMLQVIGFGPLFPCVAPFAGGNHPGGTAVGAGSCNVPYGGQGHPVADYSLIAPVFRPTNQPSTHPDIFIGGRDRDDSPLGICRASHSNFNGSMQLGKYLFATNACHISYGGLEHVLTSQFETLRRP